MRNLFIYLVLHLFFDLGTGKLGISTFDVCGGNVLGHLLCGSRTDLAKGLRCLFPHMAESSDAYQHSDIYSFGTSDFLPAISYKKTWPFHIGLCDGVVFNLGTCYTLLHRTVGVSYSRSTQSTLEVSFLFIFLRAHSCFVFIRGNIK